MYLVYFIILILYSLFRAGMAPNFTYLEWLNYHNLILKLLPRVAVLGYVKISWCYLSNEMVLFEQQP